MAKTTKPGPGRRPRRRATKKTGTGPAPVAEDDLAAASGGPYPVERLVHTMLGRLAPAVSPPALMLAHLDWLAHLAVAPGKQAGLALNALRKTTRFGIYVSRSMVDPQAQAMVTVPHGDPRFGGPAWQRWPFNLIQQSFLLIQQWWHEATTRVPGVRPDNEEVVSFIARQMLDVLSPSNYPLTNPALIEAISEEGAMNLMRGAARLVEDWERAVSGRAPAGAEGYRVGETVAATPGSVVHRTPLMELIQYAPATDTVFAEPVLLVPSWISRFYILDLSPANSLVRHLVDRGHTVFVLSWRNPGAGEDDLALDAYREAVRHAIDAVTAIVPDRPVHAAGTCLGGTLLLLAAAVMARDGDERLASVSTMVAQADFAGSRDLLLYLDESRVHYLEEAMWEHGYLDAGQAAADFRRFRAHDLLWSAVVHDYLLGRRQPVSDLMAWSADTVRMPHGRHAESLRALLLRNELAEGRYDVDGRPVDLHHIRAPLFVLGAERDHVAPWPSVYKLRHLTGGDLTLVLTDGGHNTGLVSRPGHGGRSYRAAVVGPDDVYVDPATWQSATPVADGSWWPAWQAWLAERSTPGAPPPPMGNADGGYPPLGAAPGDYVREA